MSERRTVEHGSRAAPVNPRSPRVVLFPFVLVMAFVVPFLGLAGAGWAGAVYELIVNAAPLAAWLVAAVGIGSLVLRPLKLTARRPLIVVTAAATGLGAIGLLVLGLGLAGALDVYTAWAIVGVGVVACVANRRAFATTEAAGRSPNWPLVILMPLLAFATVAAFVPPGFLWGDEPNGYDVVEYHLQIPREWYELGRIVPLTHNAFSYFPQGVEAHYLLAMHLMRGPWAGMYLAQLMHLAFVALTVAAVYAVALEWTGNRARATVAAIAAACVPWMGLLAPVAYNEGGLLLFGTLAVGWLARGGDVRGGIVAGLMAGLACGVKLTGVPLVLVAVPVAVALGRRTWRAPAACFVVGLLVFGPWLLRDQVWVGNPVFPEAARVLGKGHFTDTQVERWHRAHSPRPDQAGVGARVAAFGRQVAAANEYGYLLLPLGIVVCVVAARKDPNARVLGLLLAATVVFWLGFTHLQGRFFTTAIPLLALAVALVEWGPFRWPVVFLLLLGTAAGLGRRVGTVWVVSSHQALGLEDFSPLLLDEVKSLRPDETLCLVGDAKAFTYQRPMARLHYRTVFDVDVREGESLVDAWARGCDGARLIDPGELDRFHRTYFGIPDPGPMPSTPFITAGPTTTPTSGQ